MPDLGAAWGWCVDPYQFAFMQRALWALLVVSVVGGVVGPFVVYKGLAFAGDALAHATLAGVALAFVNGLNIAVGALVAAVVTALGVGATQRRAGVSYDTAIGILFVAMFSLGILVISREPNFTPDLFSFVFGDILGVSAADLRGVVVLGALVLLFVGACYRELVFTAYDPAMAQVAGVPATWFRYATLVMIAVAVVVTLQAVGVVLVNAMLIIPAATAGMLTQRLPRIMALGVGVAVLSSVAGLQVSYHWDVATSPAVVLSGCVLFAAALGWRTWHGAAPLARGEG